LIEIAGLVVHDVIRPKTGVHHVGQLDGIVGGAAGNVLDVLIEEAGLNPVDGLGVGKMIDKVDETRRDRNLAQELVVAAAGDGGDLGDVLRLQGDGLGRETGAEFVGKGLGQIVAAIEGNAETAGIGPCRRIRVSGSRQGGCKKNGGDPGFHFSMLSKKSYTHSRLF
jgi:hypothetical protein